MANVEDDTNFSDDDESFGALSCVDSAKSAELNMTSANDNFEILAVVDSGAVDNVLPKNMCKQFPLRQTSRSIAGGGFKAANGGKIRHFGRRVIPVITPDGDKRRSKWEVADVVKPLISAGRLIEQGHRIVLNQAPHIQCHDRKQIPLERQGNLFTIKLRILNVVRHD